MFDTRAFFRDRLDRNDALILRRESNGSGGPVPRSLILQPPGDASHGSRSRTHRDSVPGSFGLAVPLDHPCPGPGGRAVE